MKHYAVCLLKLFSVKTAFVFRKKIDYNNLANVKDKE